MTNESAGNRDDRDVDVLAWRVGIHSAASWYCR